MNNNIIHLNKEAIKNQLSELVRGTVEETHKYYRTILIMYSTKYNDLRSIPVINKIEL